MDEVKQRKTMHIALYPWFAYGHLTHYLNLANKLAQRGHKISFFLPNKSLPRLSSQNHHPSLISLLPITVPAIDGLPPDAETTADIGYTKIPLLMAAMDLTQPVIESFLFLRKPDFIFFDFAHWIPSLARKLNVKSVLYSTTHASFLAYLNPRTRKWHSKAHLMAVNLEQAPPGFPSVMFELQNHEARALATASQMEFGLDRISLLDKVWSGIQESDALCCKGCRELEGEFGDYLEKHYGKRVLWAGPDLPNMPISGIEVKLDNWLKSFRAGRVVYCALGSECALEKDQFQELILGLELTGLPFLAALKPPTDCETVQLALPEGFSERINEKGMVLGGWVQQELLLKHPSVGCFVTHCGAGSLSEALVSESQLVLLPMRGDQFTNARLMSGELRVGVEVKRRTLDGFFSKEAVYEAIMTMMDEKNEVGQDLRTRHAKWRKFLLRPGLEDSYVCNLVHNLENLLQ